MFTVPTTITVAPKLGKYQMRIIPCGQDKIFHDNAHNNPQTAWQPVPKYAGLYTKSDNKQAIIRMQSQDADKTIHSVYFSEIDLGVFLSDMRAKLNLPETATPSEVLTALTTTTFQMLRFKEIGVNKDTQAKTLYEKWGHKLSRSAVKDDYELPDETKTTATTTAGANLPDA